MQAFFLNLIPIVFHIQWPTWALSIHGSVD